MRVRSQFAKWFGPSDARAENRAREARAAARLAATEAQKGAPVPPLTRLSDDYLERIAAEDGVDIRKPKRASMDDIVAEEEEAKRN